jgi:hypothetical protein
MITAARHKLESTVAAQIVLPTAWRTTALRGNAVVDARRLSASWFGSIQPAARPAFEASVAAALQSATDLGACFVAMLAGDGQYPVCGALVVTDLKPIVYTAGGIEFEWRAAGRQCSQLSLPVGPAVLCESLAEPPPGSNGEGGTWELQVAVAAPDVGGLLLVFSTPMVAIAEDFRSVALAIASTLRWQQNRT